MYNSKNENSSLSIIWSKAESLNRIKIESDCVSSNIFIQKKYIVHIQPTPEWALESIPIRIKIQYPNHSRYSVYTAGARARQNENPPISPPSVSLPCFDAFNDITACVYIIHILTQRRAIAINTLESETPSTINNTGTVQSEADDPRYIA